MNLDDKGYSIVELLVSMSLLIMITVGTMSVLHTSFQMQKKLEVMTMIVPASENLLTQMIEDGNYKDYEGTHYQGFLIRKVENVWENSDISCLKVILVHEKTKYEYKAKRYIEHLIE